jgi:hypothetical protein
VAVSGDVPSPKAKRRVGGTVNYEIVMRDATAAYVSSANIVNVGKNRLFSSDDDGMTS